MTKILFYARGSNTIGSGHIERCKSLAKECKILNIECDIYGINRQDATDISVFSKSIEIKNDKNILENLVASDNYKLIVFDDYSVTNKMLAITKETKKVVSFHREGLDALYADIIINAIPFTKQNLYSLNQNKHGEARLLLGPEYTILNQQIKKFDHKPPQGRTIKKVLITMGGGDDKGVLKQLIDYFCKDENKGYSLTILTGKYNSKHNELRSLIADNSKRIKLQQYIDNPFEVFVKHDIAITAGGMTTYECAYLGLPIIIISTAKNQLKLAEAWDRLKVGKYIGKAEEFSLKKFDNYFNEFIGNIDTFNKKQFVDGNGAKRVARIIKDII